MSRNNGEDFVATKAESTFDDEGNTITANANVSSSYSGGLLYKGKIKNYTSSGEITKKNEAKIIQLKPKDKE
jgi:hypothetical protein